MRFLPLSALLGLLAVQQAAAVSLLLSVFGKKRRAPTKIIIDREGATHQIGNVLLASPFAQNLPTSAPTRRKVASVAPKARSLHLALVPALGGWVSKMEFTAL